MNERLSLCINMLSNGVGHFGDNKYGELFSNLSFQSVLTSYFIGISYVFAGTDACFPSAVVLPFHLVWFQVFIYRRYSVGTRFFTKTWWISPPLWVIIILRRGELVLVFIGFMFIKPELTTVRRCQYMMSFIVYIKQYSCAHPSSSIV